MFELIEIQDPTYTAKSDMECLHMYVYMFMYKSVLWFTWTLINTCKMRLYYEIDCKCKLVDDYKDNFFFKSMQHDDSDIYTKQSESIFQENSDNIYIR